MVWLVAYSQGLTKLIPTAITAIALAGSLYLLSLASKTIPLSTAYAIWTGVGSAGILLFAQSADGLHLRIFW